MAAPESKPGSKIMSNSERKARGFFLDPYENERGTLLDPARGLEHIGKAPTPSERPAPTTVYRAGFRLPGGTRRG